MSGKILAAARADAKRFITEGGFQEDITLSTPDKNTVLQTTGFATKHWISYDADGLPINTKNVHICIDEKVLIDANYPVRDANEEVSLLKHLVTYKDSSGIDKTYQVQQNYPDETLGLIVCILGDYNDN